jgi:hypothetical protein
MRVDGWPAFVCACALLIFGERMIPIKRLQLWVYLETWRQSVGSYRFSSAGHKSYITPYVPDSGVGACAMPVVSGDSEALCQA